MCTFITVLYTFCSVLSLFHSGESTNLYTTIYGDRDLQLPALHVLPIYVKFQAQIKYTDKQTLPDLEDSCNTILPI